MKGRSVIGILVLSLLLTGACLAPHPKTAADYPGLMRAKVVELAQALKGRPYRHGGGEIDGLDCSGFVRYVFHAFGYETPRSAKAFNKLRPSLSVASALAADVMVFKLKGNWHVGVYVGQDRFVHAPSQGQAVREERLNAYWREHLKRVVRIIR